FVLRSLTPPTSTPFPYTTLFRSVLIRQPLCCHLLNRLGLGGALGRQPLPVEHVHKVGVTTGVELIGPLQAYTATGEQVCQHPVSNGCTQLGLDIVANQRNAALGEALLPGRVTGNKDRNTVDEGNSRLQGTLGIEPRGFLSTYGQIVQQHFSAALPQDFDDLGLIRLW